jgi:hypothetical protein
MLLPFVALAADDEEAKALSGISIVGNNEAPKSLFIVPWKASDVGASGEFASSLLNDGLVPVDKDVFIRELRFYELSNP